jgi:hypothetical protein
MTAALTFGRLAALELELEPALLVLLDQDESCNDWENDTRHTVTKARKFTRRDIVSFSLFEMKANNNHNIFRNSNHRGQGLHPG